MLNPLLFVDPGITYQSRWIVPGTSAAPARRWKSHADMGVSQFAAGAAWNRKLHSRVSCEAHAGAAVRVTLQN